MYTAFLVLLMLSGVWIFRQGRQLQYYKQAFRDEIENRRMQASHISMIEAENRRYEDRVKKYEASLAHLDIGMQWQLRDSPEPPIDLHADSATDPNADDTKTR